MGSNLVLVTQLDRATWFEQALLSKSDVLEEVQTSRVSLDSVYRDGSFIKNHPMFKQNSEMLQLILYFDELEVANPLGSKRGKHKLGNFFIVFQTWSINTFKSCIGVFYWMLANIHPAYRSTIHSIQLLAVVNAISLKTYGIDTVLKPAVEELKKLAEDVSY